MKKYRRVLISATGEEEAYKIIKLLLKKKYIAGGTIFPGDTFHWWNGEVENAIYYTIAAFTKDKFQKKIINLVERNTIDDVPGITFYKIDDCNKNFLKWLKEVL